MTLEEAKQLEHGDRVLVEMEVMRDSFFGETCSAGAVYIRAIGMQDVAAAVTPKFIRKKIEQSRKFKKGDIVFFLDRLFFVSRDGDENETEIFFDGDYYWARNSEIKLICAVEDRCDRKEGV